VAIQEAVQGLGGKLETCYYALGEHDVFLIVDLPDTVSAVAFSMVVRAAGVLSGAKTTPLLTVEEIDRAVKTNVHYRKPGQ
jgi:uncharacterized protein with GYD domain